MTGKLLALDVDYIVKEYRAGRSVLDLASELGVSRNVIDKRLDQAGIERRGRSAASVTRLAKLSPADRLALASAAHAAVRGVPKSFAAKVRNAIAKQSSRAGLSDIEEMVCADLRSCGIDPIPQLAIGPYNCDLAAWPVAVEIFGGHWHFSGRHLARTEARIRYLGDAGWHVLMLVVADRVPAYRYGVHTGDHLVAYIKQARANPSTAREYRVIDCRGQALAGGRCDDDHVTIEPAFTGGRDRTSGRYERVPR
jgi:hypothetical protein